MTMPPEISTLSGMDSLAMYGYMMLVSPQKKPLLYATTTLNSQTKKGIDTGEGRRRRSAVSIYGTAGRVPACICTDICISEHSHHTQVCKGHVGTAPSPHWGPGTSVTTLQVNAWLHTYAHLHARSFPIHTPTVLLCSHRVPVLLRVSEHIDRLCHRAV